MDKGSRNRVKKLLQNSPQDFTPPGDNEAIHNVWIIQGFKCECGFLSETKAKEKKENMLAKALLWEKPPRKEGKHGGAKSLLSRAEI